MSDEREPKVSAAYRGLGAEEPPRALDDAIRAAARREAGARPGSPGRAGPNRWYAPLAAAAVLVLAVAVTLHLQREQPEVAEPAPAAKEAAAPPAAAPPAAKAEVQGNVPSKPARAKAAVATRPSAPEPFPENRADDARGSAASAAGAVARQAEERVSRDEVAAARAPQAAPAPMLAKRAAARADLQADTPERELERIAELRKQAKHDEADKALAEFRKRYPDFKISEALRERVERR
jgi:hypothetical protein